MYLFFNETIDGMLFILPNYNTERYDITHISHKISLWYIFCSFYKVIWYIVYFISLKNYKMVYISLYFYTHMIKCLLHLIIKQLWNGIYFMLNKNIVDMVYISPTNDIDRYDIMCIPPTCCREIYQHYDPVDEEDEKDEERPDGLCQETGHWADTFPCFVEQRHHQRDALPHHEDHKQQDHLKSERGSVRERVNSVTSTAPDIPVTT